MSQAHSNSNNDSQKVGVFITAQYIKDFSFENPNSPKSLIPSKEIPKIDVVVDVKVLPIEGNTFEVVLMTTIKAHNQGSDLFLVELSYAAICTANVPEQDIEPVLMVYCPGMLFPYLRQIISEVTRQGGFPPLLIDPIDFSALYRKYIQESKK